MVENFSEWFHDILEEANKIVNECTERSKLYGTYRECNQRCQGVKKVRLQATSILGHRQASRNPISHFQFSHRTSRHS